MDSELERLLGVGYLGDLTARPLPDVRAMRGECQEAETRLSYLRRLVQGRLDIVGSELHRRQQGGEPSELADLIDKLPEILADHGRAPGLGRPPQDLEPSEVAGELTAELEAVVPAGRLGSLPDLPDEELQRLTEELHQLEQEVSARRRQLHERIDTLQAEITRRYRTGEASVESLLQ